MDEHRALEELQRETADGWACRRATCQSRRQNSGENSGSRPRRASRNRQPHRRKPQAHQSSAGPCPTRSASSWSDGTKNTTAEGE